MDYTTVARVKAGLHVKTTPDDAYLAQLVEGASRAVDFLVTGRPGLADYYKEETITDEVLTKAVSVTRDGRLSLWPHKPVITAVSALAWRLNPLQEWQTVDPAVCVLDGGNVMAYTQLASRYSVLMARISYTGGLAPDVDSLDPNLVELATLLAARLYREDESGVNDVIGIAELGTVAYTKALPQRAVYFLDRLKRVVPW